MPLPAAFTPRQAMAIGTAGYTAMLCVVTLERHGLKPGDGEVLVTGATGGVGSVAIALLARLGYRVVAASGKVAEADYLTTLGAAAVIDRAELASPGKPLQKERWAGVVDAVGSHTLANACAQTRYGGAVAACGLAQGMDLPATVAPFILRGVSLLGIDSVMAPLALREQAWARLARDLDPALLESMTQEIALADAVARAGDLMDGSVRELGAIVGELGRLQARHGVFFVTGNHEYYSGVVPWLAELRRLGIRVLENERVRVGDAGASIDLAGVDDWRAASAEVGGYEGALASALAGRDPDRSLVLLQHQPRGVEEAVRSGVELQLSGHTHGGQIFPFNFLVAAAYPYVAGLYHHREGDRAGQVFVSRGTGFWGPPMRLGAPPEIAKIVLTG